MSDYLRNLQEETDYLGKTLDFINTEINRQTTLVSTRKSSFRTAGKDMWEESSHYTDDFEKLTEVNQHLNEVSNQAVSYHNAVKLLEKYKRMLNSPYFGRFDFIEEGSEEAEKIYIGLCSAADSKTGEILIYDWRAPVSGIFYQYEIGEARYSAPFGRINGSVLLKRQYRIQNSELKYFFDCSIKIDDEILQDVLSHNSSTKMRNIVETIQREQDAIIRDVENQLLIVQGVAGSGKTSVALHRIAYLLYHGLNSGIDYKNIIIISPNTVFSSYISSVLPELGEKNVKQITFEEYAMEELCDKGVFETRGKQIEALMSCDRPMEADLKRQSIEFKGSALFTQILDQFVYYYEHHMIAFEDIYYGGNVIETRQLLKSRFLDNKINMSAAKRLKRIESMILDKIRPVQRQRIEKIQKLVQKMDGHEFDIKPFSRLLSIKESGALTRHIRNFTEIDCFDAYKRLFTERGLLSRVTRGLELPYNIEGIIGYTIDNLEKGFVSYEDGAALLYLKLRLEGSERFLHIRQVVVDEAQDYSPLQYGVFNQLFKSAEFTVLGDINQSIEKEGDISLYDRVIEIFNKKKYVRVLLNKSYRSSFEITAFSQGILKRKQEVTAFERYEEGPLVVRKDSIEEIIISIIQDTGVYLEQGFESLAIVCKTAEEAEKLHQSLNGSIDAKLISLTGHEEIEKGITIAPAYMVKGLEFDVVLVFNVSQGNYNTELDRRLLYIACTRALHRLALYYTGENSSFIQTSN